MATRERFCSGWQTEEPSGSVLPDPQTASRMALSHRGAYSTHGLQRVGGVQQQFKGLFKNNSKNNVSWRRIAGVDWPSSCAAVKPAWRPLSSMTEQLLLGSHIVPTSATPSVLQSFCPQMSCSSKQKTEMLVMVCGCSHFYRNPEVVSCKQAARRENDKWPFKDQKCKTT